MARLSKDHIDKFYDYDIEVDSRLLYMGSVYSDDDGESGVDTLMAERVIKGLTLLESAAPDGSKPITIIMNNPGGDWYHGMAIYDAIKTCANEVTIKTFGHGMSMGAVILQAADERLVAPNAKIMIHYGTMGADNHAKIFYRWAAENQRADYAMENIFLEGMIDKDESSENYEQILENILNKNNEGSIPQKSKIKVKLSKDRQKRVQELRIHLQSLLDFDTILTAKEAVDLGLADAIIGE